MGEIKNTRDEAIKIAKEYEIKKNREPKDAPPKCGYDIISKTLDGEEFHIEVKGRKHLGVPHVFLTDNEYRKAKEISNYWLYFVAVESLDVLPVPGSFIIENAKRVTKWRLSVPKIFQYYEKMIQKN
jgi:hypothetical protein